MSENLKRWVVEPFVKVTSKAGKIGKAKKSRNVMLSSYSCEELAEDSGFGTPEVVRNFKTANEAKKAAAREPRMCHHIHTADEFGEFEYTRVKR